ncbi:MAG: phasin family protein [Sneathiella sp.]|nr:phasin family protein [Sneathiella sp.]
MTNTKAKTAAQPKTKTADAAKEFELLLTANNKTLQDAFTSGTEAAENAFKTSADAFRSSYDKALKDGKAQIEKATQSFTDGPMYDKDGAEPLLKVGNVVAETGEKIGAEIIEFGSESVNTYFTTARSIAEAGDAQKALEIQTEYTRNTVEAFMSETKKLNAMFVDASKTLMEPFGSQFTAGMDKFLNRA